MYQTGKEALRGRPALVVFMGVYTKGQAVISASNQFDNTKKNKTNVSALYKVVEAWQVSKVSDDVVGGPSFTCRFFQE